MWTVAPWTTDESVIVTVPEILAVPCARETPHPRIKKTKAKKILLIISIKKSRVRLTVNPVSDEVTNEADPVVTLVTTDSNRGFCAKLMRLSEDERVDLESELAGGAVAGEAEDLCEDQSSEARQANR